MKKLALLALLITAPLTAQTVDTLVTATTVTEVRRPAPSVIIQSPAPLNVDSLAAILAGMDRELIVVALDGHEGNCCGGDPWWWKAGLLGLGVGALIVWSRKESTVITQVQSQEQSQGQEQTVTTTIIRRGWWKKGKKHDGHGREEE